MKAMVLHRFGDVDWGRTVVRDRFVSYSFETGAVIGLEADTIQANKLVRSSNDTPASFALSAVPVSFRSGASWTTFETVR